MLFNKKESTENSEAKSIEKPLKLRTYNSKQKLELVKQCDTQSIVSVAMRAKIPKSTLYTWVKNYKAHGIEGLVKKSSRPNHSPKKTNQWIIDKIIELKKQNPEMGSKAMSDFLKRSHSIDLSSSTVRKLYKKNKLDDGDAGYAKNSYIQRAIKIKT